MSFLARYKKTFIGLGLSFSSLFLYLGWAVHLNRAVGREESRFESTGYTLDPAFLNEAYPAVPDDENAALVVLEAGSALVNRSYTLLEQVQNYDQDSEDPFTWSVDHRANVVEYVESQRAVIDALTPLLDRRKSRYPIDLTDGIDLRLGHFRTLRDVHEVVRYAAGLAAREGDGERVLHLIRLMIAIGSSLKDEPLLISQLNRSRRDRATAAVVLDALHQGVLSRDQLAELSGDLARWGDAPDFTSVMAVETAVTNGLLADPESGLGFGNDSTVHNLLYRELAFLGHSLDVLTRRQDRARVQYLAYMNDVISAIQSPWIEASEKLNRRTGELMNGPELLDPVRMLIPNVGRLHQTFADSVVQRNAVAAVVAVERFRLERSRFPHTLEEVEAVFADAVTTDAITGQSLIYVRQGSEVSIYGPGVDGVDNGGRFALGAWGFTERPDAGVMVRLGLNDRTASQ